MTASPKAFTNWCGHEGLVAASANGFEVIDCKQCGFKHCVPIPTPEELEQAYAQDYYTQEKPLYIERYTEDLDWWNSVYERRYDFLERNFPKEQRCDDCAALPVLVVLLATEKSGPVEATGKRTYMLS